MTNLRENYLVLLQSLEVDPVLPFLYAEGLLTRTEYDTLQSPEMMAQGRKARAERLLRYLPNKGKNYFQKFCICIGKSGQIELLEKIGFDLSLLPADSSVRKYEPQGLSTSAGSYEYLINQGAISQPTPTVKPYVAAGTPILTTPIIIHREATPTPQDEATPKTQRILILYSNDPHVSSLPPDVRHTQEEYLRRVSDFVQTLQMFSTVGGADGRSYSAYKCIYDVDESQRDHIQNFNVWSFENLETCDVILLLTSPLIGEVLRGKSPVLEMEKGVADAHTLINVLPRKRVIPVYLNMPKVADWLPVFLKSTPSYFIDLLRFQSGMSTVTSEEEFGRRSYLLLDEDPNLKEMRDLLAVLRREPPPENPTTVFDVPPPKSSDLKSQGIPTRYLELVTGMIHHIWQRVGLKLGFTLNELDLIRSRNHDDPEQSIHSMFSKWQERDGAEATIDILIKALEDLRLNGVVHKVKAAVEKDEQKDKK